MAPADDRAVSEIVGAVILFGFLVIAFSVYQGVVIPQQNKAIEFDHNGDAQDAIQDLRNAVRQTATTGTEEAISIKLGATYPPRVLGINPGGSGGTIATVAPGSIVIRNVSGTEAEVTDYFGDSTTTLGPFESKVIIYRPVYFQYRDAPSSSYENTVAFNHFPNGANLSMTNQALIKDRKITLIAINGSVSEARSDTISIDTEALSMATNTVSVTNQGGPVNITISTRLTADEWRELLAGELTGSGGFVTAVNQTGPNQVSIRLKQGVRYELRLAKVGVGTNTRDEGPKYVVDVDGDDTSVPEGGTQKLVAEVRDRYNNPVSNVSVTATVTQPANPSDSSEGVAPTSATTNARGLVTFIYTAPDDVNGTQTAKIDASFDGDGTANETVTFDVRVLDVDGSGGGGTDGDAENINPGESGTIILDDQSSVGGGGTDSVTITLKNTTSDGQVNLTAARISFFFNGNSGTGDPDPTEVDIFSTAQGIDASEATTVVFGSDFEDFSSEIPLNPTPSDPSDTTEINLVFNENIEHQDFYVISIKYSNGDTYTYFISHPN